MTRVQVPPWFTVVHAGAGGLLSTAHAHGNHVQALSSCVGQGTSASKSWFDLTSSHSYVPAGDGVFKRDLVCASVSIVTVPAVMDDEGSSAGTPASGTTGNIDRGGYVGSHQGGSSGGSTAKPCPSRLR